MTTPATVKSPRLMPIGWMILVLAGVLYLAGSNIGSGWVIILTAAMVGAVVLDLLSVWRTQRRTEVTTGITGSATTTTPVIVRVAIRRPDLGTTLQLSLQDGASRTVVRPATAQVEASIVLDRGHHQVVRAVARTVGPVGLTHAIRTHPSVAAVWCRPGVLPAQGRIRVILGTDGESTPRHAERGEDIVRGVREFTTTDPRRAVHWRATARQGRLMVREMDTARGARVRLGIAGGTWSAPALDLACEVLASLATAAQAMGHDTEVAVDGATHPWDDQACHLLAGLPPAVGIPPRPLRQGVADATLWLHPSDSGVDVDGQVLGDRAEVARWLRADA